MTARRPVVAITLGDPSGVGPECLAAALARPFGGVPMLFGDETIWARACRIAGVPDRLARLPDARRPSAAGGLVPVTHLRTIDAPFGRPTGAGLAAQIDYVQQAIDAVRADAADALCTGPITKAALAARHLPFPGHTEWLAHAFGVKRVVMLLAGPRLRVALQTIHVPLRDVAGLLTTAELYENLSLLHDELRARFGLQKPRIAVLGLNPHAGDGGLFGDEEARVIAPAVRRAQVHGIDATGPFAADGLFPRAAAGAYDAVLAMYHDQGLGPAKLLDFAKTVNVTLGLPKPRTSPDHGPAYELAGTGRADPTPTREALRLAVRLAGGTASRA